jgi:small subunit ribosomal protein S8
MTIQDPISDLLTRIRNAHKSRLRFIEVPFSIVKKSILNVLLLEGYIDGYFSDTERYGVRFFVVFLKYYKGEGVVRKITRLSKPSVRVYKSFNCVPKILGGLGIAVLSTPFGVISSRDAFKLRCGGELLCTIE